MTQTGAFLIIHCLQKLIETKWLLLKDVFPCILNRLSHCFNLFNVTEDIPSDAEAEARSHCIDEVVTLPVDNGKAESQGHVSNTGDHNLIIII